MTYAQAMERMDVCRAGRKLLRILEAEIPRRYTEGFLGNARLAVLLGRSVRTVQLLLRQLKSIGLIEIVRDYGLNTRRRLVLMWRVTGATAGPLFSSMSAKDLRPEIALTKPVPPDPPIEVSEDEKYTTDKTGGSVVSSLPPEILAQAAEVFGAAPAVASKLSGIAAGHPAAAVKRALDVTKPKARAGLLRSPWAFLRGVLRNLAAEGLESPPAITRERLEADRLARRREAERKEKLALLRRIYPEGMPTDRTGHISGGLDAIADRFRGVWIPEGHRQ